MKLRDLLRRVVRRNFDLAHAARVHRAYQEVFRGEDADFVMEDLAVRYDIFDTRVPATSEQALYRAGQRSVVMFLLDRLENDEQVIQRLEKARERHAKQ